MNMKPISLTMKAFGSFANETTVSFENFQSGPDLVVGETGAGKTTIFDAIVFALFGTASGTARKPEMMHSDYVEKSEDTSVCLVFDHGGRRYTVTRKIHFTKRRGLEEQYGDGALSATLIPPEGQQPVNGHTAVTRRCEELLGLNADQFRKIVMLAQGEFREFLSSDSGKKSEILGRLFDSSAYVRYQNLLAGARAELASKRKRHQDSVEYVMQTMLHKPEEEEDSFRYNAGNPQLIDNLDQLIERETETAGTLQGRKTDAQKAVDGINNRKGAAAGDNQKLDELKDARKYEEDLNARRGEMELLSRQYAQAEKALRRVRPAQDKWSAAKGTLEQAEEDIRKLQDGMAQLENSFEQAKADVEGDADANKRIEEIKARCNNITESLPRYTDLEKTQKELDSETKAAEDAQKKLQDAQEQSDKSKAASDAAHDELRQLENADVDAERMQTQYDQKKANADELRSIKSGVDAVRKDENTLALEEKKLAELAAKAARAESAHHEKYQAFITGQAGLLAEDLKKEISSSGSARCPVCHALHRAGEAHDFAQLVEGTPTQAEVDAAKRDYDGREKDRKAQQDAVDRKSTDLVFRRDALVMQAGKLLEDCDSWETLVEDGYLESAIGRFNGALEKAKLALDEATLKKDRKKRLQKYCEELSEELETLAQEIKSEEGKKNEAEKREASLRALAEATKSSLPFKTRAEAEQALKALGEERSALERRVNDHEKTLEATKADKDRTHGELEGKEKALPDQQAAALAARRAYDEALQANGFANEDAYAAALAPVGGADGEEWLMQQWDSINSYQNNCDNTAALIKKLQEQTKDLHYTDLAELERELAEANERRDAADQACTDHEKLLDNHKAVRKEASRAREALAKTDRAWRRLDRLADLALGTSGEGGRLSFERHVMGSIFREVLEMANRRLDIMSGGRYTLMHQKSANRANSAAGLEIEVLDVATGRQRAANSLSGGESFQVSLSLALGLSDVVQAHAGGIGLDTIFIDEGFGALDGGALDNAITVLNQLAEGNRLVGVISHVDKLEESIPQKLRVKKTAKGSVVVRELS